MAARVYLVQTLSGQSSTETGGNGKVDSLGDQRRFAEHSKQDTHVQRRSPDPKSGSLPITSNQVAIVHSIREEEQDLANQYAFSIGGEALTTL
jgi:hypothetical protein